MSGPIRNEYFRAKANIEAREEIALQLSSQNVSRPNGIDPSLQRPYQDFVPPEEEVDPEIIEAVSHPGVLTRREVRMFGIHTPLDYLCKCEAKDAFEDHLDPFLQDWEREQLLKKYQQNV